MSTSRLDTSRPMPVNGPAADVPPWLQDCNPEQQAAVTHDRGPLLIAAGAGTGKTRTLATRVAHLLHSGVAPDRILLLTFTRRAAREMLQRARAMTGDRSATHVLGGTFHSVAHRWLRAYGHAVGLPASFGVLDASDATELIGIVRTDLGLGQGEHRFPRASTIASMHSRVVNAGSPLAEVLATAYPWCAQHHDDLATVLSAYTARKRKLALLDLDDMLLYLRALTQDPVAGTRLAASLDHVLVDEAQDLNVVQGDVLTGLRPDGEGLTIVGDDAQAIYGFRAASPVTMRTFPARHPGTTAVTLERNYRSSPEIIATANDVLAGAADGFRVRLTATSPSGTRPILAVCRDEAAQAAWVVDQVLARRERGTPLRQQAVLFRTTHHADRIELECAQRDVPFVKFGGLRFLETAHVRDLLALLRVVEHPFDELAWQRVLGTVEGLGPARIRTAVTALGVTEGTGSSGDPLARFLAGEPDLPIPDQALGHLRTGLGACVDDALGQRPVAEQVEACLDMCRLSFPRRYPDAATRLADLEPLVALAASARSRNQFLADITLDPPVSASDLAGPPHLDDDLLVLSTIHSAKGGEWDAVHVVHVSDGCIPSDMALSSPEGIEEERRLLYVAMTRARRELALSYPRRFFHHRGRQDDAHCSSRPSRFLDDVRDGHLDVVSVGADDGPVSDLALPSVTSDPVAGYLSSLW